MNTEQVDYRQDPEDVWGTDNDATDNQGQYPIPFIYDGNVIRYNTEMGIHPSTPMVVDKMHVNNHIKYGHGGCNSGQHTHITGAATYVHRPNNTSNIYYINSIPGPVKVLLGEGGDQFAPNQTVTFKDISLHYGNGSANNITIQAPEGVGMETHMRGKTSIVNGGMYNLNTNGGTVTLKHVRLTGARDTWIIEHCSHGNLRLAAGFKQVKAETRQNIAGNKNY